MYRWAGRGRTTARVAGVPALREGRGRVPNRCPDIHVPSGSGSRRGSRRPFTLSSLAALIAVIVALTPGQASAEPTNPADGDIAAAQSAQEAAASEVGRIAAQVAAAESELQRVSLVSEAANEAYRVAEGQLQEAQQAAAAAAEALRAADEAVAVAQADVADLGRESYMRGGSISGVAALLDAEGPADLLEQASTLRLLGDQRAAVLEQFRVAQVQQADADSAARAAVTTMDAAAADAAQAKSAADAQVSTFTAAVQTVTAQKSAYEGQLRDAQVRLLELQGQRNAYQAWEDQQAERQAAEEAEAAASAKATAEAAARARQAAEDAEHDAEDSSTVQSSAGRPAAPAPTAGAGVAPTSGRFTTCYEMRWGTMHSGIDIAAPTGTPIYAPAAGRVVRAGAASGYGLAVYIEHADGSVTVYGHINDYFVQAGERVSAGDVIAEVGNTGQSTGPHLHFQVNTQGLHAGAINPIPWLAEQGVSMGGRCR